MIRHRSGAWSMFSICRFIRRMRRWSADITFAERSHSLHTTIPFSRPHTSSIGTLCKVFTQRPTYVASCELKSFRSSASSRDHVGPPPEITVDVKLEPEKSLENVVSIDDAGSEKIKRKKLKGKRAVVRWLKFFRWKKKKQYERMTAEEKILYKLKKARNKEARLVEALKKIDPPDPSETTHDPEILTPEEHFYFLRMGRKSRNYVPIGRRGIYQGVILNMHLHWKKHQTLKVIVKTFTAEEVREIAAELARLSGGIVLEIYDEDTIIMYRGKNYVQPPTEIMSPKVTLSRRKALDKSKYRESLRAVRKFIPRLEQDLEDLKVQAETFAEFKSVAVNEDGPTESNKDILTDKHQLAELLAHHGNSGGLNPSEDCLSESNPQSDSESLSDILEIDSELETDGEDKKPLYLDEIEKLPSDDGDMEPGNFEEQLRQISAAWMNSGSSRKDAEKLELDEVDRLFLRAGSLLRKKRR